MVRTLGASGRARRGFVNASKRLVHGLPRRFGEKPIKSEDAENDAQNRTLIRLEGFVPAHEGTSPSASFYRFKKGIMTAPPRARQGLVLRL